MWNANSLPVPVWNTHPWAFPTLNRGLVTDPHTIHSYGMGIPLKLMPKDLDIMAARSTPINITGRGGERFLSQPYAMKLPYAMSCHDSLIAKITIFPAMVIGCFELHIGIYRRYGYLQCYKGYMKYYHALIQIVDILGRTFNISKTT